MADVQRLSGKTDVTNATGIPSSLRAEVPRKQIQALGGIAFFVSLVEGYRARSASTAQPAMLHHGRHELRFTFLVRIIVRATEGRAYE